MGLDGGAEKSTRQRSKLLDRTLEYVLRNNTRLVWVLVCFGCLGTFLALPLVGKQTVGTDEKALIIGSLGSRFEGVVNGSLRAVSVAKKLFSEQSNTNASMIGLHDLVARADALRHSETTITGQSAYTPALTWQSDALTEAASPKRCANRWTCTRIHGGRGDGTESLLLVFVIDESANPPEMVFTIALATEAALLLQSSPWLAKHVYVAILQGSSDCPLALVTKHWLGSYSSLLGLPQQGLVINVESTVASEVYLDVIGYNGQLPNLDMVALTTKNIETFTHLAFRGEEVSYITALLNNIKSMARLANPMPKQAGAHAVLLENSIDALTLYFTNAKTGNQQEIREVVESELLTARQVLMISEMVMRTCNNLQERLHHASSLYFLVGQRKAVSIGVYILIPASLLLAVLIQWTALAQNQDTSPPPTSKMILVLLLLATGVAVCGWWWITALQRRSSDLIDIKVTMLVAVSLVGLWKSGPAWCDLVLEVTPQQEIDLIKKSAWSWKGIKMLMCSALFVTGAALLLLRWATCTFLLLAAVPLLQML